MARRRAYFVSCGEKTIGRFLRADRKTVRRSRSIGPSRTGVSGRVQVNRPYQSFPNKFLRDGGLVSADRISLPPRSRRFEPAAPDDVDLSPLQARRVSAPHNHVRARGFRLRHFRWLLEFHRDRSRKLEARSPLLPTLNWECLPGFHRCRFRSDAGKYATHNKSRAISPVARSPEEPPGRRS